ncbi:MAG: IS1595 family transposase [Bacteroidetes bacterium]|nr:IS1595 family transposase [Bacteroidota bacterium]
MDGLNKKDCVLEYIELLIEGKSLDKIIAKMCINKKTYFDYRHLILSSLGQDSGKEMEGIVESDETFFEESSKGNKSLSRPGRQRGKSSKIKKKRGCLDNKVAVIVTVDRKEAINMCVATMGRISKEVIIRRIATPLTKDAIFCTDGHVSYKDFAMDNRLKHITLMGDLE